VPQLLSHVEPISRHRLSASYQQVADGREVIVPAARTVVIRKVAVPELWEDPAKYYVTDGPLATSVSEVSAAYFQECMHAGRGRARVVLSDGTAELISGSPTWSP
jgi:hypothetical protein